MTLYLTARHTEATLEYMRKHYTDAFTFRLLGGKKMIFASKPEWIETIFSTGPPVLVADTSIRVILGRHSIIVLSGPAHEAGRKLLMPSFKKDHVQIYRSGIDGVAAEEFTQWPIGQPFALLPRLEALTLAVIMSVLYGERTGGGVHGRFVDVVAFRQQNKPLMMMLMNFARRRPPEELQKRLGALHDEQNRQIEHAREDPRLAERHDVLAMLVGASHDDGSPLSNEEIRDHLMTIIVQGHTPTAVTMAWVMERLVRHPEWLERVRAEANTGSEENLDAVITETLRLRHSAGPFMGRRVAQTFRFGPYEVPPGLLVGTNAYTLHRRPELYEDPHAWKPERWFGQKPGYFTYIPFGGGDRHCIGRDFAMYEMKLVLRAMLRQFRFARSHAPDEKSLRRGTSWIPKDGAQILIQERIPAASQPQQPAAAPPATP